MYNFFGLAIPPNSFWAMCLPLLLAVVLGGLIGLERELHGHPAGLRTHILVCVGSTLITLVSVSIGQVGTAKGDPARLAAQIVSGIGFLGAGAILREGATVHGLTTAASVWTTAGIGIALGANPFYGQLAVVATAIVLTTLWLLNRVEDWIDIHGGQTVALEISVRDTNRAAAGVLAQIAEHDIRIQSVQFAPGKEAHTRDIHLHVCFPMKFDRAHFLGNLSELPGVLAVHLP